LSVVFAVYKVICFDEDLSESALSYWIVLSIELVKPVERVAVLKHAHSYFILNCFSAIDKEAILLM